MSREVFLRVTLPKDVEGAGLTVRNQPARIRSLDIPVKFLTAKSISEGATLELVVKDSVEKDGETTVVEQPLTQTIVTVAGTSGQIRLQAVNPVRNFVEPKFAAETRFTEPDDEEEDEDEEEDQNTDEEE